MSDATSNVKRGIPNWVVNAQAAGFGTDMQGNTINFSGGGGGGSVTPSSVTTFTNKTMDYNSNTFLNLPGAGTPSVGSSPFTIGANLVLTQSGLTASRTFTFPDVSDQVVTRTATQTLTSKTIDKELNTIVHDHAAAYYFVFFDGTNYKCLNQKTGLVESTNTDAATVINYALSNATNQRVVLEAGTYTLSTNLAVFNTSTDFCGQGWKETVLVAPTNLPCITVTGTECSIHDMMLTHNQTSYTSACLQPTTGSARTTYYNLYFYDNNHSSGTAIQFNNNSSTNANLGIVYQLVNNIAVNGFATGIDLHIVNAGNWINANTFSNINLLGPGKGITCTTPGGGSTTTNMDGNVFFNIQIEANAAGRSASTTGFDFTDAASHVGTELTNIIIFDLQSGDTFMNVGTQLSSYTITGCFPDPFSTIPQGITAFPPNPMTSNLNANLGILYGGTGVSQLLNNCSIRPSWPFGDFVQLSPLIKKSGMAQPAGNTVSLTGLLSQHTFGVGSTLATAFNTTYGMTTQFTSAAVSGSQAGLVSPTTGVGIGRTLFSGRMAVVAGIDSTTSSRFYFGVTNNTVLPISDNPLATTDQGIIVGFNTTDTNWTCRTCWGGGTVQVTSLGVPKDANIHRIEINWLHGGNYPSIVLDNTTTIINQGEFAPGVTANLYFNLVVQTAAASARTLTMQGCFVDPSA